MRYKKNIFCKARIICIILLLICVTIPLNVCSNELVEIAPKESLDGGFKTLYLKANCSRIYLYKPWYYPVHIGSFWFTSELAFLCLFVEKDLLLKLDGVEQDVELPAILYPWKFIGFGPLFMIRCIVNPTKGEVTMIGLCQDVIIEPYSYS